MTLALSKDIFIFSTERKLLENWSSSWNFYRVVPRCIFTVLAWHTHYPWIRIEIASASHSLHLWNPLQFSVLKDKNCLFLVEISVSRLQPGKRRCCATEISNINFTLVVQFKPALYKIQLIIYLPFHAIYEKARLRTLSVESFVP